MEHKWVVITLEQFYFHQFVTLKLFCFQLQLDVEILQTRRSSKFTKYLSQSELVWNAKQEFSHCSFSKRTIIVNQDEVFRKKLKPLGYKSDSDSLYSQLRIQVPKITGT